MTLGNENIGASFWRGNINAKGLREKLIPGYPGMSQLLKLGFEIGRSLDF
jgi:hypothetical protein